MKGRDYYWQMCDYILFREFFFVFVVKMMELKINVLIFFVNNFMFLLFYGYYFFIISGNMDIEYGSFDLRRVVLNNKCK